MEVKTGVQVFKNRGIKGIDLQKVPHKRFFTRRVNGSGEGGGGGGRKIVGFFLEEW